MSSRKLRLLPAARTPKPPALFAAGLTTAGILAITAIANRILTERAERHNRPRGKFVTAREVKLHYVEQGSGSAVILLHGNGSASEDFLCSGIAERLAAKHRVLIFDRPGFGHSERPRGIDWTPEQQAALLADGLVRLGVSAPILLGHSWGTLVAIALAQDPRLGCRGLVLASGYYLPLPRLDVIAGSVGALPLVGPVLCHTILPFLVRMSWPALVRNLFAPKGPQSFAAFPKEMAFRPSQIHAAAQEAAMLNSVVTGLAGRARRLRIPITFIAGTADQVVDPNHSATLHHHLAGTGLELLPLQGHMVHHTARARVIAAIERLAAA